MNFKIFACLMMCSTLSLGMDGDLYDLTSGGVLDLTAEDLAELHDAFSDLDEIATATSSLPPPPAVVFVAPPPPPVNYDFDEALDETRSCSSAEIIDGYDSQDENCEPYNPKKRLRPKAGKASRTVSSPSIEDLPTDVYSGPILGTLDELIAYFGPGPNLKQDPGRPKGAQGWAIPNFVKQVYAAAGKNKSLTRGYFGGIHLDTLMNVIDPDFRQQRNKQQVINKRRRNGKA